jgi:hypothetical protein
MENSSSKINLDKELAKDDDETKIAPKWVPDDAILHCQLCSEKFTFLFRKVLYFFQFCLLFV